MIVASLGLIRLDGNMGFDTALLPEMLNVSHDMLFIVDIATTKLVYTSDTLFKRCGYTLDDINEMGLNNFRVPIDDNKESFVQHLEELSRIGQATDYAYILVKGGEPLAVEVNAKLVTHDGVTYNIASARDISKRLKTEQELSKLNRELEALVEKRTDALQKNIALLSSYKDAMDESSIVSKSDLSGIITYVNDKFCEVSGYTKEELIGKAHNIIRHKDSSKETFQNLWNTIAAKKPWKGILKNSKKDGSYYWVDIAIVPILDFHDEIVEYIAIRHEITELIEQRIQLQQIVVTDALTGFRNRYKLLQDISLSKNPSIALIDINKFNEINDIYGHYFGDKVIIEVAKQIEKLISNHATKRFYRLHSDVFAILNVSLDKEIFIEKIKQIVRSIDASTILVNGQEIVIEMTSSISFEQNDLLATADMALKYAKRSKLDLLVYNSQLDLNRLYENNLQWTNKIRAGIARGAFVPFYQPIVNNSNGKWEKYESLIRLIDEDGTIVSPFFFLEIAKNTKYYETLTQIMIRQSFETFKNSQIEFSINLTIKDILNSKIQEYIDEMLATYNIGNQVVFEIVESEGIEDFEKVLEFIVKVKRYGCKIAIDDFGTGYSNFSYLLKLQTDYIKIDGSLIKNLDSDKSAKVLVKTIVGFAKELGIKTIAEFVENEVIQKIVKELGVDYTQGYLFSPPMANPDFSK